MTTPAPIDGYNFVVLTAGPDTQPEHMQYDGIIMALPVGADVGSSASSPGLIKGVRGYPNGTNELGMLRWVMSSDLPTVAKTFIHNLPDTGWVDANAENTYRTMVRALVNRGIPMADIGTLITNLHNASVVNERMHASST